MADAQEERERLVAASEAAEAAAWSLMFGGSANASSDAWQRANEALLRLVEYDRKHPTPTSAEARAR